MMHHHQVRRGAALAALPAVILTALLASSAEAQLIPTCRMDVILENQLRRVTGAVMVECPGVHSAPFGNWGVESDYESRRNTDQFRGWKPHWGTKGEWNSCTLQYYDGEWVNDGRGKQKADGDDVRVGGEGPAGYGFAQTCRNYMPEVYTAEDVDMELWELDTLSPDDYITTLEYGDIDVRITCYDDWDCRGESEWHTQNSVDSTGVSAKIRVKVRTYFSWW